MNANNNFSRYKFEIMSLNTWKEGLDWNVNGIHKILVVSGQIHRQKENKLFYSQTWLSKFFRLQNELVSMQSTLCKNLKSGGFKGILIFTEKSLFSHLRKWKFKNALSKRNAFHVAQTLPRYAYGFNSLFLFLKKKIV